MNVQEIKRRIEDAGMTMRGGFHVCEEDGVPPLHDGVPAGTLILVGNAGPAMWRAFTQDRGAGRLTLDAWSQTVVNKLSGDLGGMAHFPFTRPYMPFQRWAMKAEACHVSPLGILIHPDYGLWHGYRGALAFAGRLAIQPPPAAASPCDTCADRPCLSACPVSAFDPVAGYDVPACAAHLSANRDCACMLRGCLARHACPVGRDYIYEPEQANFHMTAFLSNYAEIEK